MNNLSMGLFRIYVLYVLYCKEQFLYCYIRINRNYEVLVNYIDRFNYRDYMSNNIDVQYRIFNVNGVLKFYLLIFLIDL